MFCAISGEPPKNPVVSKLSGLVYEQRLIQKYIEQNSKDPVTGDELSLEDLVEIKSSPKAAAPRPPSHSSIPSLLTSLQNEYDAIILEAYTLKKQYDNLRQELAHALYANDASARVVARLIVERDQAREALANIQSTLGASSSTSSGAPTTTTTNQQEDVEMTKESEAQDETTTTTTTTTLPAAILSSIDSTAQRLTAGRKAKSKRKAPQGYSTPSDVTSSYSQLESLPSMHSTKPAGVSCLQLSSDGDLLFTGGNDKNVQVYDRRSSKVIASLKGHSKRVTRLAVSGLSDAPIGPRQDPDDQASSPPPPAYLVSASEDKTIKIWVPSGEEASNKKGASAYRLSDTISTHKAEVTGLDIHPSGELVGAASRDGSWSIHSLKDGSTLLVVESPDPSQESEEEAKGGYVYESFAFHPDGQLAATGTSEGSIRIWDVKQGKKVTSFQQDQGKVESLSFSENGYYLASSCQSSNLVKIWDLRKLNVAGTIEFGSDQEASVKVRGVRFDPSAQMLAIYGSHVKLYANKSWNLLANLGPEEGGMGEVTDASWDHRDGSLITSGSDRVVRVFGKSKDQE
ncbi:WD40 repeat-like protein [Violaceomyces palustris]|uniref:WD40 repeat-like protein n=1 Tax=Violaceomyces palustris TaxID=1673888 RepID=A0ACD0NT25_9BASI|nr:WD40 repeat-like protein [Violaceomyces palustris]